jgi:uncharacterized damage-inducible protein DinB
MTPSVCLLMAQYNSWMNQRIYEAAFKLTDKELFAHRGAFFGSLFKTLNHIAVADLIWLHRFSKLQRLGGFADAMKVLPHPTTLTQNLAESLGDLAALRTPIDQVIVDLATAVDTDHLSQTLHYGNVAGTRQAKNVGLLLLHLFNHQTHHRGQASTLLFQAGVDVGITDLNALVPSTV